jgi:hypothetical protein
VSLLSHDLFENVFGGTRLVHEHSCPRGLAGLRAIHCLSLNEWGASIDGVGSAFV